MNPIENKKNEIFLKYLDLALIILLMGGAIYFFVEIFLILFYRHSLLDIFFTTVFLLGEIFVMIHAFGFLIDAARITRKQSYYYFKNIQANDWPSVAVVLPARNEPAEVLDRTIVTLSALDYSNKRIYFIDDSSEESYMEEAKQLAEKYQINYFRPNNIAGMKAGAINEFLLTMHEEYLAVFDADQNPMPSFLKDTVSMAECDEKIAFIQTPQFYSNIAASHIAKGATIQQSIFFEVICEAKSMVNAMFCCGTNVLIRKHALIEAGGFDVTSVTEDFATSVKLHMLGYKSIYYNKVSVFGMAPESLPAYFKQQARWSSGTTEIFISQLKNFINNRSKLTASQWWEYFLSGSYYFVGWSFFFLMLCPVVFLIFAPGEYFIGPGIYIGAFITYFIGISAIFFTAMKKRNYKFSEVYRGSMLGALAFPILMVSTVRGMFGKKKVFVVTPKGSTANLSFLSLWPWTIAIILNILAIWDGVQKFSQSPIVIGINIVWCLYYIFFISHIYYFNSKASRQD